MHNRRIAPMSTVTLLLALSAALFVACGGADHPLSKGIESEPTKLNDYGFEAPDTIAGGTVEVSFTNKGKEPHFAGLAVVKPGTFEDVQAAITAAPQSAAPSRPPPFEDVAGIPTADPGETAKATLNLPAGTYALFCLIPSANGVSHAHKGMVRKLTVTPSDPGVVPEPLGYLDPASRRNRGLSGDGTTSGHGRFRRSGSSIGGSTGSRTIVVPPPNSTCEPGFVSSPIAA